MIHIIPIKCFSFSNNEYIIFSEGEDQLFCPFQLKWVNGINTLKYIVKLILLLMFKGIKLSL